MSKHQLNVGTPVNRNIKNKIDKVFVLEINIHKNRHILAMDHETNKKQKKVLTYFLP